MTKTFHVFLLSYLHPLLLLIQHDRDLINCVYMLQIILGITRYNSVLLGFKTELNGVVLSYTELYRVIPKIILEHKNGPIGNHSIYENHVIYMRSVILKNAKGMESIK